MKMTAQIGDVYKYQKKDCSVVALSSPNLFAPMSYGLELQPSSTACYIGYWYEYT